MMKNKKNSKDDSRKKIYDFIMKHPGLHFAKISRDLNIPKTTLNYHLKFLLKQGLVINQKESRYHRYFITDEVGNANKKILNIFRKETPCDIILYLLINTGATQAELSKNLEKHPTTIEFHLRRLDGVGLIERLPNEKGKIIIPRLKEPKIIEYNPVSNDVVYKLKDSVKIYYILKQYKKSFVKNKKVIATINIIEDALSDRFLDKVPRKTKKHHSDVDVYYDLVKHFIPMPWCA